MFRGFEPGAFKLVKISITKFKCFLEIQTSVLQSDCSECYSTELHKIYNLITVVTPLTHSTKSHDTVLLARPTFINSSATHNLSRRSFSPKSQRRLLPCLLYKSFFYVLNKTTLVNTTYSHPPHSIVLNWSHNVICFWVFWAIIVLFLSPKWLYNYLR